MHSFSGDRWSDIDWRRRSLLAFLNTRSSKDGRGFFPVEGSRIIIDGSNFLANHVRLEKEYCRHVFACKMFSRHFQPLLSAIWSISWFIGERDSARKLFYILVQSNALYSPQSEGFARICVSSLVGAASLGCKLYYESLPFYGDIMLTGNWFFYRIFWEYVTKKSGWREIRTLHNACVDRCS